VLYVSQTGRHTACEPEPNIIQISSRRYPDRPVVRTIKTKHAGLNLEIWATSELTSLTGYKLWDIIRL
tara:strand:+ start:684 stop:887 length:204 start_codon:yes stop_codon:yes gene_type:complete